MKRPSRSIKSLLAPLLVLALGGVPGLAWGADTGQFLFTNAEPLPVDAGGTVFFRVLAVNQGNVTWDAGKTYLVAEIYDKDKKYVASTDRFNPATAVSSGGSLAADLKFAVPIQYSGEYSFRVFLVHNEQRVVQSDYKSFPVTPQVEAGRASPLPVTLGGNVVVSYRNDTGPNGWQADTSINLSGTMNKAPFEFSANTIHSQKKDVDLRTFLLNAHAAHADIGLGDVSPNFSPLSVSGSGVRGVLVKSREIGLGSSKWVIEAVGARAAEAKEGSAATDGVFERLLYGAQSSFILPGHLTLRGNYVQVDDVESSLSTPGPTLKPAGNRAAGGGISWAPNEAFKIEGDWQHSAFEANKTSTSAAVTDSAWRTAAAYTQSRWSVTGAVSRSGSNFVNLAAPGVAKDRLSYDGGLMLRPWDWITLNNSYSEFRDNLADDAAKTTSHQRSLGSEAAISFPTRTRLALGHTLNQAYGDPRSTQDNKTEGVSTGLHQEWDNGGLDLSYQRSEFTDRTTAANSLMTNTYNAVWNWTVSSRLSTSVGSILSQTRNKGVGSMLRTKTYSLSFNSTVIPNRVLLRGFGSLTDTTDDGSATRADKQDANYNLETTWKPRASLGLTLGLTGTSTHDRLASSNNKSTTGVVARVSYTF